MTAAELIADAVIVAVVLGAAAVGLCAHLCWLAFTDPRELGELAGMFWEVVRP